MKILFPNNEPTVVTTKTEREQLRRAETLLRHASLADDSLKEVARGLRTFVDEQEKQAEDELDQLAEDEAVAA